MKFINTLIKKYNKSGPRYTSYPPVPFWTNAPSEDQWISHIRDTYSPDFGVDLYVHVPYCESLCYYCGCNRTITKNHNIEDYFVDSIIKEFAIYKQQLGFDLKINSLHFGGGTPTFLSPKNLEKLINHLTSNKSGHFIGSIEIDPRTCTNEHIEVLTRTNILRVSLGIQDFDPIVQKAIHREQSVDLVTGLIEKLRDKKIASINFDLIYGLPKQTVLSIRNTIDTVIEMKPDLIAFYSYAHLPEKIKNQKLINESDLPTPEEKKALYDLGKKLLLEYGYIDIGMDHFALPSSFLYLAKKENRIHRNFMGYVDKKSPILIGLGPSSISDSSLSFIQNKKETKEYFQSIEENQLPLAIGHTHSQNDLMIQNIILSMMCNDEVLLKTKSSIPFWDEIHSELLEFESDGLIVFNDNHIQITDLGKCFVRNIAMCFDENVRNGQSKVRFSQTI